VQKQKILDTADRKWGTEIRPEKSAGQWGKLRSIASSE
jgi:hypothetical protein